MKSKGAAGSTVVLAITAAVVTLGFFFWLYQRSSSLDTRVTPVMENDSTPPLTLEEFRAEPDRSIGRRVALKSVPVAARLGRAAFAVQLDDTLTYPVLLTRDLILRQYDIYGGDHVSLWGNVYALNDSIRGEWVRLGAVDETSVGNIPMSASFVLVDSMTIN